MGLLLIGTSATFVRAEQPGQPLPADSLPETWQYVSDYAGQLPGSEDTMWWHRFNDATLDTLISLGLDNNYDVLMAARRMEVSRQTLNEVRSLYFPSVNISGGWTKNRTSGAMSSTSTPASSSSSFNLGADLSWQIDIFGKITAQVREGKANWQASRAEYAGAMLTLCGDIASSYIQLRMLQAQKKVAEEHLQRQETVVNITRARYEAGLASQLDVLQASTVYSSTKATLPGLNSSIQATMNAINVLVGDMPGDINSLLISGPMPDFHMLITAGVPRELIRRRPDIVQAEANLAALAAAVGIAKKDFLPTLSLNGSIGSVAHSAGDLFKNNSLEYSIAPTLSWTVFDGMKRKYAVAAAKEQMLAGIDSYNLTVLTAVKEVENALISYKSACEEVTLVNDVVNQARKTVDLSVDLYKSGLSGFTDVANAQMTYLSYSNTLIESQGKALTALINLCEALGGGWTTDNM